ncbi:MAG: hypothetical protein QOI26_2679 [Pseudonocardiales bacterium]|nr:hypothetical protein [Pseudonocardiales bacterium]
MDKDIAFTDADQVLDNALDQAYRRKYRRYSAGILDSISSAESRATTTVLAPASAEAAD